jgi:hypothetical protein
MHGCRGLDFRYVLHRRYLKSSEERFYVHAIFGGKQMSCLAPRSALQDCARRNRVFCPLTNGELRP